MRWAGRHLAAAVALACFSSLGMVEIVKAGAEALTR